MDGGNSCIYRVSDRREIWKTKRSIKLSKFGWIRVTYGD